MERLIDFFIIGAQKCGTTAFYEFLGQHPDIFIPSVKELHFFVRDEFYEEGERYLEPLYASAEEESTLGGADVESLYFHRSARRLWDYNPNIKLIALLRNPVDRAYSAYWYMRQLGFEDAPSFEDALEREEDRKTGSYFDQSKLTYLGHGHYHEQLSRFLEFFDREQTRIILTEDFNSHPARILRRTLRWLGLSPDTSSMDLNRRVNPTGTPRSMTLQKLLRSDDSSIKTLLRNVIPHPVRLAILRYIRKPLLRWNVDEFSYPPMRQDTRARLNEYFAPHNEALARLLGTDLGHWQ